MKGILALVILAVFATITESSVIPLNDNIDDAEVRSPVSDDFSVVPYTSKSDVSGVLPSFRNFFAAVPALSRTATTFNLNVGTIGNSMLIHMESVIVQAQSGVILTRDVFFGAQAGFTITAIRGSLLSGNPGTTARITGGGVGNMFVMVRLTSARGAGIAYHLGVYGRWIWGPSV